MLRETYFNKYSGYGEKLPAGAIILNVTREKDSILSPSWNLLMAWREHKINWSEYTKRFRIEILNNPEALQVLRDIKAKSETKDIWLVCVCSNKKRQCHRYILMDIIEEMK